jgi:uncharacterized protein with PIN domain
MQFHEENSNIQSVQHIPTADFGTNHNLIHGNPNLRDSSGQQVSIKSASIAVGTSSHGCAASTADAPKTDSPLAPYLHNPAATTTGTALGFPPRDDLDLMLKHEDFPMILILTTKVKQYREMLLHAAKGQRIAVSGPVDELMDKDDAQVLAAVARMQNQLLSPQCQQEMATVVVRRGEYPLTDATMDDALKSLEQEFEHICKFVQRASNRQHNAATTGRGKKDSAAIAVKYSKWQTDLLMGWMIDNVHHPFPSHDDIRDLMQSTGLSQSQVVNWTTNVRKRNRKATCENGKKPHHFIDFMFLAHYDNEEDRKQRERGESVQDFGHLHSSPCNSNGSDLTTSTAATKKASPSSSRSNKKNGNNKMDSAKMPPSPAPLLSAPVTPPTAVTSHPPQAGAHPGQYYYDLQQHYNQHQYDDPYHYHQRYEHFQQLHWNHQSPHQQHYHHGEGGMHTSPEEPLPRARNDEDFDHDSSSPTYSSPLEESSDRARDDDDRDDAHSLALAPHCHEGEPESHIDPDLFFAAPDDDDDHDEREQEHELPEVQQHRWGALADSNTAELFSAMPFWGNEIGEDAMVLGGLSWLGGRGDLPSHLDRHDNDDNVDGEDEHDDSKNDDTATSAAHGDNPIVQQEDEQLYLCDWIPSILPTVTQDSTDFWLSIQAPLPLPPPNHGAAGSSISAGGPKRGHINTIDATNILHNDSNK